MKIEHIAIWTKDLDSMKAFYERYFGAKSNSKYTNEKKGFSSYFLSFESGARLELMSLNSMLSEPGDYNNPTTGIAHFAVSTGSKENVNRLTQLLQSDGFVLVDGPRWTGDGYYESVVLDPEQNRIEITV